jgi:hypothetical protein
VKVELVDGVVGGVNRPSLKSVQSLVLIKRGSCHVQ